MRTFFSRYLSLLTSLFIIWLFLVIGRVFGINFGLDISIFFKVFLFLFAILIILEAKERWQQIWPTIKSFYLNIKASIYSSLLEYPTLLGKIIHFFPVLFYSLGHVSKKYFNVSILIFCLLTIIAYIFVFDFTSDLLILVLIGLWVLSVWLYKFEERVSFIFGLIFLMLCPFLLMLSRELIAEKAALWAYLFLVVGIGQMFIKYLREERRYA